MEIWFHIGHLPVKLSVSHFLPLKLSPLVWSDWTNYSFSDRMEQVLSVLGSSPGSSPFIPSFLLPHQAQCTEGKNNLLWLLYILVVVVAVLLSRTTLVRCWIRARWMVTNQCRPPPPRPLYLHPPTPHTAWAFKLIGPITQTLALTFPSTTTATKSNLSVQRENLCSQLHHIIQVLNGCETNKQQQLDNIQE